MRAAAHGDCLLVGPLKDYPLGVMDLATKENKILIKQNAADMFDGVFVTEQFTGQLAMHTKENPEPLGVLSLPEGGLGRLHASAASGDLRLLAVSSKSRGAIWDVPHDLRAVQMPNFDAIGFDGAAVYVDVPEFQGSPRETAEVHLDTGVHSFHPIDKDEIAVQHGLYMVVTKPRKEGTTVPRTILRCATSALAPCFGRVTSPTSSRSSLSTRKTIRRFCAGRFPKLPHVRN